MGEGRRGVYPDFAKTWSRPDPGRCCLNRARKITGAEVNSLKTIRAPFPMTDVRAVSRGRRTRLPPLDGDDVTATSQSDDVGHLDKVEKTTMLAIFTECGRRRRRPFWQNGEDDGVGHFENWWCHWRHRPSWKSAEDGSDYWRCVQGRRPRRQRGMSAMMNFSNENVRPQRPSPENLIWGRKSSHF